MRLEEFRHSVLSLMMVSDQFAATASSIIQPRFFDVPAEQHLCRFILELYREYHKPPKKLAIRDRAYEYLNKSKHLQRQLEEFDLLLDAVCDLDEAAASQASYIQTRIVEFCKEQALKEAILKSVDYIQAGKLTEILPSIQKAMSVGADLDGRGIYMLEDADSRETVEEVRNVISTGIEWMDAPMKGGLARRELCIVMAPPNVGKTTVLINLGSGLLKNRHKVAHFTCEMGQGIVRGKYDQAFLKKTDDQLKLDTDGRKALAEWMKKLRKNLKADVYIKDFPPHRLTIEGLKAHLLLMKHRDGFEPDAVIID
jgi:replicative DNA helicase